LEWEISENIYNLSLLLCEICGNIISNRYLKEISYIFIAKDYNYGRKCEMLSSIWNIFYWNVRA